MGKWKKIVAVMLAVLMICSDIPAYAATKSSVTNVNVSNLWGRTLILKEKSSFRLHPQVSTKGHISKQVTFTSSNSKVARVTSRGTVTALKKGKCNITITSKANRNKKYVVVVYVGTPVSKVTLNKKSVSATQGDKVSLKATIYPKTASYKHIGFYSSNKSVATVSSKGVVTCKAPGTVTIKARAFGGGNKYAICKITIKKKAKPSASPVVTKTPEVTVTPSATVSQTPDSNPSNPWQPSVSQAPQVSPSPDNQLSYDNYNLKWSDDFNESTLNKDDWNYEVHEPGWVNNELQEYTTSDKNTYTKDGKLVIKPIKTVDETGKVSYTSGRINTKGKHDFKYGLFEAKLKVPEGKGFLPAFWMMPTDENLYGQWPRCGEIDIMEVLGDSTQTAHGTIHYGNPHSQSAGTYTLKDDTFSDSYHTFACEWEPGSIKWYVDGKLFHQENDWYTTTVGQGTVTYPAPFDQPFYMILNLAVGGNWPGNPDETTDIDNATFEVDYVKVYQKDSYDENVKKPVNEVILRDPAADGNYMMNADFSVNEDLTDNKDWTFLTTGGGEATAKIADNAIQIDSTNEGTLDYSIQLVQPDLPMKKGGNYELSFDAKASANRVMKVDVSAPDRGYIRYLPDTVVELKTDKQSYTYSFTMTGDNDANGRLEFNLGNNGSTESVWISNVTLKKVSETEIKEDDTKTVLTDGNHVYNGAFQEGDGRTKYWDIAYNKDSSVSVTNTNNERRLKVNGVNCTSKSDITVGQKDLALSKSKEYMLSFDAFADVPKTIEVDVAGIKNSVELTTEETNYSFTLTTPDTLTNTDILFMLGNNGITYLDNVRIVENSLIKNGDFSAGFAGFEVGSFGNSNITYVVDSQKEDSAADITINHTGDASWHIQLIQHKIPVIKDQKYVLTLDMKSSLDREVMISIQHDGSSDNNWISYSGEQIVDLTSDYQKISIPFTMESDTDPNAMLSISLGAINGNPIDTQHRVCIDNISLSKVE